MCSVCQAIGIDLGKEVHNNKPAEGDTKLTRNEDGTYNLRLTEEQLKSLTVRLALSVLAERRGW